MEEIVSFSIIKVNNNVNITIRKCVIVIKNAVQFTLGHRPRALSKDEIKVYRLVATYTLN